jgi:hypothetical protein
MNGKGAQGLGVTIHPIDLTVNSADWIRELNNYLQSIHRTQDLSWEFSVTGPNHQAMHTAVVKCLSLIAAMSSYVQLVMGFSVDGMPIGEGRGVAKTVAKWQASYRALIHLGVIRI